MTPADFQASQAAHADVLLSDESRPRFLDVDKVSFEALPKKILEQTGDLDTLPQGARIFIPALPGAGVQPALPAVQKLGELGRRAVPHLPARSIRSSDELETWLGAVRETGCDELLLLAGDVDDADIAGPYRDSLDILASGLIEAAGFRTVAVAGHPEGHPHADEAMLDHALTAKVTWAKSRQINLMVVTQFSFDMPTCIDWIARQREILDGFPIHLGLAGPAKIKSLMKYAMMCGVRVSSRTFARQANVRQLLTRWSPDDLVMALGDAPQQHQPDGIHIYPFGGMKQSAGWVDACAATNN